MTHQNGHDGGHLPVKSFSVVFVALLAASACSQNGSDGGAEDKARNIE